jgi:hypothetical protein
VNGHVWLKGGQWTEIPAWLKNVEIIGDFSCSYNNLISLKNCPQKIGGIFKCSCNQLTSLEGCPANIGGYFTSYNNKVKLELPHYVKLKGKYYDKSPYSPKGEAK